MVCPRLICKLRSVTIWITSQSSSIFIQHIPNQTHQTLIHISQSFTRKHNPKPHPPTSSRMFPKPPHYPRAEARPAVLPLDPSFQLSRITAEMPPTLDLLSLSFSGYHGFVSCTNATISRNRRREGCLDVMARDVDVDEIIMTCMR